MERNNNPFGGCLACPYHYEEADGFEEILLNFYCEYSGVRKTIASNIEHDWEIRETPNWCPLSVMSD